MILKILLLSLYNQICDKVLDYSAAKERLKFNISYKRLFRQYIAFYIVTLFISIFVCRIFLQ